MMGVPMAETEDTETTEPAKKSKLPLIVGIVLAIAGGGGGFFAVQSGLILSDGEPHAEEQMEKADTELPDISFVPIDPIVVSLNTSDGTRHLKFSAQLEVPNGQVSKVEMLLPRVVDVFNSYLRAVEAADLEEPTALIRLRAHLLRRAELVLGDDSVSNLLIMEFVLN